MLEINGIVKKYGKKTIIKDATGLFERGRIYGLAGYNGAGKTTVIKNIMGNLNVLIVGKFLKQEFIIFLK